MYSPEFIRFIVLVSLVNLACSIAFTVIGLWAIVTVALRPPWRVAGDAALDAFLWIALLLFILAVNHDYIQSVAIRTLPYRLEVSLFFSLFIIGRFLSYISIWVRKKLVDKAPLEPIPRSTEGAVLLSAGLSTALLLYDIHVPFVPDGGWILLLAVPVFCMAPIAWFNTEISERMRPIRRRLEEIYSQIFPPPKTIAAANNLPPVPDIPFAAPSGPMQLLMRRSQRMSYMSQVIFTLDARIEVPSEQWGLIQRFRLGDVVVYDSAARQRHDETTRAFLDNTRGGPGLRESAGAQLLGVGKTVWQFTRAGVSAARAGLSLRVTVRSLIKGIHIESKNLNELLSAENAIVEAAENLKAYLEVAATFDGREDIREL